MHACEDSSPFAFHGVWYRNRPHAPLPRPPIAHLTPGPQHTPRLAPRPPLTTADRPADSQLPQKHVLETKLTDFLKVKNFRKLGLENRPVRFKKPTALKTERLFTVLLFVLVLCLFVVCFVLAFHNVVQE